MLRFKIKELIGKKEFEEGRRVTISEIANATGIHRMTLSKMINQRGYNTGTDNLDRLCKYFDCQIQDLVEYVPDGGLSSPKPVGPSGEADREPR